jgi:phenylpropionate dioxygenase-like ring-hydroxylating dioxygenase large terminal subunit
LTDTLPYRWYTDPEILARERERLFSSAWQYAGHSGELAEPGSYLTLRVGEIPLVVVRDRAGTLRAFVNVCRHRGAEVVTGSGSCTTLSVTTTPGPTDSTGSCARRRAPRPTPDSTATRSG